MGLRGILVYAQEVSILDLLLGQIVQKVKRLLKSPLSHNTDRIVSLKVGLNV